MPSRACDPGCTCGLHTSLSLEERFWRKVDRTGNCWLWTASMAGRGYGQIRVGGRYQYAHRVAYELAFGPISSGLQVDHRPTCRRSCVNPAHLRLATNKQNNENRAGADHDSLTGVRGVSWDAQRRKYEAKANHLGKTYHAGRFDTLQEAEMAAIALRNGLFTHNDADRVMA